ncbi:MAG: DegV family EDD domain-containing protein [Clostridiales bacterium]|nr:DegV family EDD domain-containing protein [Clostridiales bacterium]
MPADIKNNNEIENYKFEVRKKIYVICSLVMIAALMVSTIETFITYQTWQFKVIMAAGVVIYVLVTLLTLCTKRLKRGSFASGLIIILFYIPFTFFMEGGISGDAVIWLLFTVMFISLIMEGIYKWICLFLEFVVATGCYYVSLLYPQVIKVPSTSLIHIYSYVALLATGLATGFAAEYIIRLYRNERIKSDKQMKEIQALNASQNQFFSSMSHEIRTPINTIIGLNEMILREDISDEVAEDAANIRSAGKMLLSLINDILDMSKLESGQMQITDSPYHPGDMLSDIVGMLWIRAREKKLEFHVNVAPDIPDELSGDEVRIKQVLINVLNNAIKYTREGSVTLFVQCERLEDDKVNMIYTVEDTGIGIKKEDIPFLFTAFKRVDEGENRHIEGTGLGLSIVKRFTELMGGKVTVNSVYTAGTTFIIEIPQTVTGDGQIGQIDLEHTRHLEKLTKYKQRFEAPKARVLVVDDNASNIMVVTKLLRDTKVQIDSASNGIDALELTQNNEYDVIFMDHLMPEMDGIECFRRIRNQVGGRCRDTKTVILTANAGEENKQLYEKEGFHAYLVKPVSGEELEEVLYRFLPSDLVKVINSGSSVFEETISWMQDTHKKRQVAITTESVADLPPELLEKHEISIIPHKVLTEEGLFKDSIEIDTRGVLSYLKDSSHHIQTAAPDAKEHEEFFAGHLRHANNIVHVSISSSVENSGCPIATEASKAFDNVTVFDSGHLSSGQGLLALTASELADKGKTAEEIVQELNRLKHKVSTSFIVDNIDYLARAGQINQKIANLTKSVTGHPVLTMRKGNMTVKTVFFGSRLHSWQRYIDTSLSNPYRIDKRILFVTYVGITNKEMEWIRSRIEEKVKFDEIYFQKASPAIAVNCGPGTFGLLYMEK